MAISINGGSGGDYMKKGVDYVTAGQKSGTTLGTNATAEGSDTTASGSDSHAEGSDTTASGNNSHAEGEYTTASGWSSHTEGFSTTASGWGSHSEGDGTNAQRKSQHVFGEYNILDTGGTGTTTRGDYIEIVGNGTSGTARSNARTLDWSGNEVLAGKLTVGADPTNNMDVATKLYVDTELNSVKTSVSNGKSAIASAITDKGVSTSGSDSFATMATNIENIQTGHTITLDGVEYDDDVDLVSDLGRFEVYSTTYPANLGSKYTLRPNLIVYNNELYKIGESFTYGTVGAQSYISRTVQKWDGPSWTGLTQIPISNLCRFGLVVNDNVIHYYKANDSTISHYTFNGTTWTLIGTENVDLTSFSRTINSVYCIHNAFIYNDTVYLASFLKDSDTYYCLYFMKYNGTNWVQATELGSSYRYRMKSIFNSNTSGVGATNISNFVVYNNEIHYLVTYSNSGTWNAYRFKNGSWSIIDSNLNSYNNVQSASNATVPVWLEVHNDSICCAIAVSWGGGSSNPSPIHYSLWYKNSTWDNKRALIPVTAAAGEASGFISWNGELHYIGASATGSSSATKFWYKFIENYIIE